MNFKTPEIEKVSFETENIAVGSAVDEVPMSGVDLGTNQ